MQNELVSIITPMYNSSRFVAKTIESVLAQTYQHWEMLIVNDGSNDNSADIVEEYTKKDNRIKLLHQTNAGSAAARNNALNKAKGKFIVFLDSDDIFNFNFLEKQINFLKRKNAAIVFSSYNRMNELGEMCLTPFIVPEKVSYKDILKTLPISCLTAMYDVEKIEKHFFRPELKSLRDDYVMWLEMLKKIDFAYGNKEILASYRVFANSTTGAKRKVIIPQFKVYYNVEKLGLIKSIYYLVHWAIAGFFKYNE